jgi:hypothetical protein
VSDPKDIDMNIGEGAKSMKSTASPRAAINHARRAFRVEFDVAELASRELVHRELIEENVLRNLQVDRLCGNLP